ncbi:MAG: hypothetical protein M1833_000608 [Piccolia ochrophora]|nr:MAG: hypothetical protein M1833_000608 [Piccolia ochrophora]
MPLSSRQNQEQRRKAKTKSKPKEQSTRFFLRAIDVYESALERFPLSFDVAYNKLVPRCPSLPNGTPLRRKQATGLAAQIPSPLLDLLRTALESHRKALSLQQDNADALFHHASNTAQVLNVIAEHLTNVRNPAEAARSEAASLLEEAVQLFQRCLAIQEFQLANSQNQVDPTTGVDSRVEDQSPSNTSGPSGDDAEEEQWASIVEPVTTDILLDTAVAHLETLITFYGIAPTSSQAWIEEYAYDFLRNKVGPYAQATNRHDEASLVRASLITTLAETSYKTGRIDAQTYEQELHSAFPASLDLSNNPHSLCERAEALTTMATIISPPSTTPLSAEAVQQLQHLRWRALTSALSDLTTASAHTAAEHVARIHLARGDTELLRAQLGRGPHALAVAASNAPTLVKNGAVYYRGAKGVARNEGEEEEAREAVVKEAVAAKLCGEGSLWKELVDAESGVVMRIVEEMRDEGMVDEEWDLEG